MAFIFVEQGEEAVPVHINQYGDALSGTPGAGQAILMTSLNNAGLFAVTIRNQDSTNGRALDVVKQDGSGDWLLIDRNGPLVPYLVFAEQASVPTPGNGKAVIYFGSDGHPYYKADSSGIAKPVSETSSADIFLLMGA